MNKESKVLSVQRDGSTTIKKMLIDGHNYTLVMEGKKIIHKKHDGECTRCLQERLEDGTSIMVDGKECRLSPMDQGRLKAAKQDGDHRDPAVILGLVKEPKSLGGMLLEGAVNAVMSFFAY